MSNIWIDALDDFTTALLPCDECGKPAQIKGFGGVACSVECAELITAREWKQCAGG